MEACMYARMYLSNCAPEATGPADLFRLLLPPRPWHGAFFSGLITRIMAPHEVARFFGTAGE
jgi:hypothetical protein